MEKLQFDSGVKSYRLNGGSLLRFNPADPNVYARFLDAADKFAQVEQEMTERARKLPDDDGAAVVQLLQEADKQMKQVLTWVFGQENDFDKILGGINLLAVAGNGERVITNLLAALQPVLIAGAESCAREKEEAAVEQARARRAATC